MIISVRSVASAPCTVTGYPEVTFRAASGSPVPFRYRSGKGQYVTHRRPRAVLIGNGRVAYFLVAKYRCDVGIAELATGMTVDLAGQGTTLSVPAGWLRGLFDRCTGGTSDPGNTVMISPFEPSIARLVR